MHEEPLTRDFNDVEAQFNQPNRQSPLRHTEPSVRAIDLNQKQDSVFEFNENDHRKQLLQLFGNDDQSFFWSDDSANNDPEEDIEPQKKRKRQNCKTSKEEVPMIELIDDDDKDSQIFYVMTRSASKKTLAQPILIFPFEGSSDSVTLTDSDLRLLEPEQFLNDSIIEFYLK